MLLLTCFSMSIYNQSELWLQVEASDHSDREEVGEDPCDRGHLDDSKEISQIQHAALNESNLSGIWRIQCLTL